MKLNNFKNTIHKYKISNTTVTEIGIQLKIYIT